MTWIIRALFAIAALITAFFVERDALNFGVIQMLVSILLITVAIGAATLWSLRQRQARDAADN